MIYVSLPSGPLNYGWGVCSAALKAELEKTEKVVDVSRVDVATSYDAPLLSAISGPDFMPLNPNVRGKPTLGIGFIEHPSIAKRYLQNAHRFYDGIICGSTWMADWLSALDSTLNVSVALQGVDYETFKPGESVAEEARFTIFSGGKFEYRKGQDIVVAAFDVFHEKHPESQLLTCWGNMWPDTMRSMNQSKFIKYRHIEGTFYAGLEDHAPRINYAIHDHHLMAKLYRSAHIGLFPNRCEAGNNLVMCEAIASGLPVIASPETGHKDLRGCLGFDISTCLSFEIMNGAITGPDGWWEIDRVDDIVRQLEIAYDQRNDMKLLGLEYSGSIRKKISWASCAEQIRSAFSVCA